MQVINSSPDRKFWNVTKGVAICLVILGHVATWSTQYVYLFHLPLFFFISGYLYNESKYGDSLLAFFKAKFKSLYFVYVIVFLIIVLLHNVLFNAGLLVHSSYKWNIKDYIINVFYVLIGASNEYFGATLWFLPASLIGCYVLASVVSFSRIFSNKIKFVVQTLLIVICTLLGFYLLKCYVVEINFKLLNEFAIGLGVLPFLWVGYLVRNYYGKIVELLNPVLAIVLAVMLVPISRLRYLDLIFGCVYYGMYFVGFMGIYLALCVSKVLYKTRYLSEIVAWIGKQSLIIMIVHIPILRVFDKFISIVIKDNSINYYIKCPIVYERLWPIYIVVALGGSLFVAYIYRLILKGMNILAKKNK